MNTPNWELRGCCNRNQNAFLITIGIFIVVILLLWRTFLLTPFKLITVFLHEASHAVACKLTCGDCTAAIRILSYGCAADATDEYLRLGASTAISCLEHFVEGIIYLFGEEYLRRPTPTDLQRLLAIGELRGFLGMIGSIDCMHWEWKNCPTAWKGQYTRGSGKTTIVLEAVASPDLWIWHSFFGPP